MTVDRKTAQVDIQNRVFTFTGSATVTKFEEIQDPFTEDIAAVETYCIEAPKFWMVLVTNPSHRRPGQRQAPGPEIGRIWSIVDVS